MESYGAWLYKRLGLMSEIKLGKQEIAHECTQKCVGWESSKGRYELLQTT